MNHFIGLGAQKSGTTFLSRLLDQHQKVYLSEPKELHFFNKIRPYYSNAINEKYERSIAYYESYFQNIKEAIICGEFTPEYLYCPFAAQRIQKHYPAAKLLISIRHPLQRAFSQYKMLYFLKKVETRSFKEVLQLEAEYLERGMYFKQLSNYLNYFPKEQIKIILFEDLIQDPQETMDGVFDFLNVESQALNINTIDQNNSGEQKYPLLSKAVNSVYQFGQRNTSGQWIKKVKQSKLLKSYKKWTTKKVSTQLPPPDEEDFNYYLAYCSKDIQELSKLIKRDLSHWTKI